MCCGKNRAAARAAAVAAASATATSGMTAPGAPMASASSVIMFESVQHGATVVRGPVSGRLYRFGQVGDRVRVDARDRPGMAAMPGVRWVR